MDLPEIESIIYGTQISEGRLQDAKEGPYNSLADGPSEEWNQPIPATSICILFSDKR